MILFSRFEHGVVAPEICFTSMPVASRAGIHEGPGLNRKEVHRRSLAYSDLPTSRKFSESSIVWSDVETRSRQDIDPTDHPTA
jgi:hypothetical protein